MLLGDLGAEVIKVEKPDGGDDTRSWAPPYCGDQSTYFLSVNRNKKSVAINIKDPKGAELVGKLAEKCDVLVENYVPGKLDKLGLGYDSLKIATPSLIYCSITGYGQGGPYGHKPGYDVIVSGIGGLMHITGPEDGSPCKVGVAVTDLTTGLFAQGSIMAALIQRQKTGKGQKIECSLLASQPCYLTLPVVISMLDLKQADMELHITVFLSLPPNRFAERTTEEWIDFFDGSGIPCGPINDIKRVFEDPQVKYKDMVQELDHPTAGSIRLAGPAVEYDGQTCQGIATPPPMLGQHTNDVLIDIL
ncbi:Succinate--hydroxymethylglutarate CoA-transferase, partial [Acropora cervicornis]